VLQFTCNDVQKQKIHELGMKSSKEELLSNIAGTAARRRCLGQTESEDLAVQGIDKFGTDNSFRERSNQGFPTTESTIVPGWDPWLRLGWGLVNQGEEPGGGAQEMQEEK
jgi:hypothetical protein